ncbi:MAG: GAF domain-containing protein [Actinobacteria bacterium]|nr:GAF domain-containing protein [Actinomycetota bacterium]MBU2686671.1 GAF domain-containing protein [Actinomycetota bacterium]
MDIETRNIQATRLLFWLALGVASLALAFGRSWVRVLPFSVVLGAGALTNALSYLAPVERLDTHRSRLAFLSVQLGVYIIVLSLAVAFSGGFASPVYACYFLVLLVPALSEGPVLTAASCVLAACLFAVAGVLAPEVSVQADAPRIFIGIVLLVAFPVLANVLSGGIRRRLRDGATFSALYRVSSSLGESLDLDQVLKRLLEQLDHVFHTDISSVRLLDPTSNTLVVKVSGADTRGSADEEIEIKLGEGFIGWVAKTGEPFITSDISTDPRFASFPRARKKVVSAIAVPIRIAGRTVGVISCAGSRQRRFGSDDLSLLESVASLAGAAIERAELYQQLLSRGEAVMESLADGLIVVDGKNQTVLTNPSARHMLGVRPMQGESLEDILKGRVLEWRQFARDVRIRILEQPQGAPPAFTMDLNLEQAEGAALRARVGPISSHWDQVIGAVILLEDVTDMLRLTGELAVEKTKLEAVLENVVVGVVAVNDRGEVLIANTAAFNMLGIARPWWWLGARLDEAVTEPELAGALRAAVESSGGVTRSMVSLKSGRQLDVSCVPIKDLAPGRSGVVAVINDVTEIRRLEQSRSDFVSMVSHELRTPLTSIKAYVDTLQRQDAGFDEETRTGFVKVIARETERMIRLINDLLDLSRIEAGRLEIRPTPLDLAELISRVASRIEPQALGRRISIDVPGEMEPVMAEAGKLEQVLLNIVSNAIKFSPEDGEIRISARPLREKVMIEVRDQGSGIAPENLPYIFDRYTRVGRPGPSGARGSGLGLYVTRKLVEAHGGRIWADSEQGKGTSMLFTVPFAAGAEESETSAGGGSGG